MASRLTSARREAAPAADPVIAVIGEALIDLVVSRDGDVAARPGGGPYNTARSIARLGARAVFAGRLSGDGFGRMLRSRLAADGVSLGVPSPSGLPTTLAVADVDEGGAARYGFYLEGTSAADLGFAALSAALPRDVTAVHVGTLGLVMEPIAASVERLVTTSLPTGTPLMVDPNCRPGAIADRAAYLRRLWRILARTDVVKASVEDLAYLFPDVTVEQAASAVLSHGPTLVLATDGPRPARAFLPGTELSVDVPAVAIVDTIGAGDAFGGAFLVKWTRGDMNDPEAIRGALAFAAEVAARTCARPGADPPHLAELGGDPQGNILPE
jgi:fructokinase